MSDLAITTQSLKGEGVLWTFYRFVKNKDMQFIIKQDKIKVCKK